MSICVLEANGRRLANVTWQGDWLHGSIVTEDVILTESVRRLGREHRTTTEMRVRRLLGKRYARSLIAQRILPD